MSKKVNMFKFQATSGDVVIQRITTRFMIIQLAKDASLFTDKPIRIYRLNSEALDYQDWEYIGQGENGKFHTGIPIL